MLDTIDASREITDMHIEEHLIANWSQLVNLIHYRSIHECP